MFVSNCSNESFSPKKDKSKEEMACLLAYQSAAQEEKRIIAANGGTRCITRTTSYCDRFYCYSKSYQDNCAFDPTPSLWLCWTAIHAKHKDSGSSSSSSGNGNSNSSGKQNK